jgi:hypothetical protein
MATDSNATNDGNVRDGVSCAVLSEVLYGETSGEIEQT